MSMLYLRGQDGKFYPVEVIQGPAGPQGPAYTLTDGDKAKIVEAVVDALPVYNGEVV